MNKMKKLLALIMIIWMQSIFAQGFFHDGTSQTMRDVLQADCCLLGQYKINGYVGMFYNKITYLSPDEQEVNYDRYGINFNVTTKFYKEFQLRLSFYSDLNQDDTKPKWLSNLYYSIGNYNWRDKTFSYGYENYQPNRFDGTYNWWDNMKRGFFFVSYNYYLINGGSKLKIDETSQIYVSPFVRYQPEYTDRYGVEVLGYHKTVLGTSVRYAIARKFYIEGAVYFYPKADSKMPWDPDFTYGFGLFDWRSFKLNVSYGNWIANRFPWNDKEMKNDFTNGEFKLMFTYIW